MRNTCSVMGNTGSATGKKPAVGFIGAGRVGTALASKLSDCGYPVVAVSSRSRSSADRLAARVAGCAAKSSGQDVAEAAELVFVTTPDDAIAGVVAGIVWRAGQSVVHCSGADSVDSLEPANRTGALTGCFHPLQTFADLTQATDNIAGSTFAVEAGEPLLGSLKEMATALGGDAIELGAGDKVVYHAAAVIACNYLVTLVKLATDLWATFGVDQERATRALAPLLRGTIANIERIGLPDCLTGPIARGDTGTITKHLEALGETAPELVATYRDLGRQTVPIAAAKGSIDRRQVEDILCLLKDGLPAKGLRYRRQEART